MENFDDILIASIFLISQRRRAAVEEAHSISEALNLLEPEDFPGGQTPSNYCFLVPHELNALAFSIRHAMSCLFRSLAILIIPGDLRADLSVAVHPTISVPTWDGWGTSLAWWANAYGGRADFANLLFATNQVTINGISLPGLGLNIVRYNIGASLTNTIPSDAMQASTNIPAFKQIPGYWLNWFDADPSSPSWNWANDSRQRAALQAAKARGVNHVQLFSNSPLWWMCDNHNPSGSDSGISDN